MCCFVLQKKAKQLMNHKILYEYITNTIMEDQDLPVCLLLFFLFGGFEGINSTNIVALGSSI